MNEPKVSCKCPNCGVRLRVDPRKFRSEFRCPRCQQDVSPTMQSYDEASAPAALQESSVGTPVDGKGGDAWINPALDSIFTRISGHTAISIGRFQIQNELGQGGFGKVYKAFDPLLQRTVALKVPTFGAPSPTRIRRFETEARSAARLHHPNIVAVYEHGETENGQLYIASEFVKGKTVRELVENAAESVPLRRRVQWIHDLADALAYAHAENIIHRDIKPENILVSDANDRAKLVDFGLAKVNDPSDGAGDNQARTQDGLLGTPAFMSPEQAKGTISQVGPASDQYSLGAALYQCLTGVPPYRGSVFVIVAAVAGHDQPTAIESICPRIPKDLVAICNKAMSKEINHRYAGCRELRDDLNAWLNDQPVSARRTSLLRQAGRFIRQHPWPTGLTCVSLTLLGLLAFTMSSAYSRADRDRTEINRQRLSAEAETRRAEELIVQLRGANGEIEQARNDAVAAMKRAESALADVQRQTALTLEAVNDRKKAVKQATAAEEVAEMASQQAKDTEYKKRIQDAADLIASGKPASARNVLPSITDDSGEIELRYLRGCLYPLVTSFECPSNDESSQVCTDLSGNTLIVREKEGDILHAKTISEGTRPHFQWSTISGLPTCPMALTLSGKSLVLCGMTSTDTQVPANMRGAAGRLIACEYEFSGQNERVDLTRLNWLPMDGRSIPFPSGLLARGNSDCEVRVSDSHSGDVFSLSRHCLPHDWNSLTSLKMDNDSHYVEYRQELSKKTKTRVSTRKGDNATFASKLPYGNSMLIAYENGTIDVVEIGSDKVLETYNSWIDSKSEDLAGVVFHPRRMDVAVFTHSAVKVLSGGVYAQPIAVQLDSRYRISSVSFAPSGKVLVVHANLPTVTKKSVILTFDVTCLDGRILGQWQPDQTQLEPKIHTAFSNDNSHAVLVTKTDARVVSANDGEVLATIGPTDDSLLAAYFKDDEHVLLITRRAVQSWHWKTSTLIREYTFDELLGTKLKGEIQCVAWIPERASFAFNHGRGVSSDIYMNARNAKEIAFQVVPIGIDDPSTKPTRSAPQPTAGPPAYVLACNPTGNLYLVAPAGRTTLEVRTMPEVTEGAVLLRQTRSITCAAVSSNSRRILTGHDNGVIKFWDASTGEELLSTHPTGSPVKSISISDDSRKAIVTSADGAVQLIGDVYMSDADSAAGQ